MYILTPLFTALIAVGSFIRIPLPMIPITLQTLICFLMGLLLPVSVSSSSILLYLFLGAIGLPVFTSGGGLAALFGPTGGYLLGMVPAVIAGSLLARIRRGSFLYNFLVTIAMNVCIYIVGLIWLGVTKHLTLQQTLAGGLYPFIAGDLVKMVVASIAAVPLYPQLEKLIEKLKSRKQE